MWVRVYRRLLWPKITHKLWRAPFFRGPHLRIVLQNREIVCKIFKTSKEELHLQASSQKKIDHLNCKSCSQKQPSRLNYKVLQNKSKRAASWVEYAIRLWNRQILLKSSNHWITNFNNKNIRQTSLYQSSNWVLEEKQERIVQERLDLMRFRQIKWEEIENNNKG